ncbi:hypothetical protein M3223_09140 [Paenibacillus pasadenensis]|uniref:hypothetical protein n=1 Tax=Paenibacillus pasadenensis TaxID=217090 RepID=UPI00203A4258|nr:hypothetical protein [Paenibacillus pasadenensis]MCM3747519.1 hypothetical protein [Paenibacillus pasadenensis]
MNLHITRAARWFESDETPISLQEWKNVVLEESDMTMVKAAEIMTPAGITISVEGEGMAAWEFEEGCTVWFKYRDGEICVPYEEEFIDKVKHLAAKLQANVLDEENEMI